MKLMFFGSRFELGYVSDKSRAWHSEIAMNRENVQVFTWQVFKVSPGEQSCDGVVVHVQERHLVLFLPQNKENLQQTKFVHAFYKPRNYICEYVRQYRSFATRVSQLKIWHF
jgi:hypothetical protein